MPILNAHSWNGLRLRAAAVGLIVATGIAIAGCTSSSNGFVNSSEMGATGSSLASSYDSEPGKTSADGPRKVIENPTIADLAVPGPLGDRFIGRADAPVTVVEYASLTCPYCRKFHAEEFAAIKKKYIDSGKVRWVLREFPIGHSSGNAWVVNRCVAADKYFDLFAAYLAEQPSWVSLEVRLDQIHAVAARFGMTRETFNKCLEDKSLIDGLKWVKARGRELGVTGTPTFFVGDKKLRSVMTLKEFEAVVEPQLANPPAASVPSAPASNG